MKTVIATLALSLCVGSIASAANRKPANATKSGKTYTATQRAKYAVETQMNKKYQLGGSQGNSMTVTLKPEKGKKGFDKFSDYVFEGPGSQSYEVTGEINLKTDEVTKSRISED